MPALVGRIADLPGAFQFQLRPAGLDVGVGEDDGERLADRFGAGIAEHGLGADVPVGDHAVLVQRQDAEVACAFGHQLQVRFAQADAVFRLAPVGDVDEGQHRAFDAVLGAAIGQQACQVPAVGIAAHLAFHGAQRFKHAGRVARQVGVIKPVRDVQQGPARVAGNDVEHVGRARREPLDVHLAVDKQRGDVGGRNQVLQVVIDLGRFVHLGLELGIHGDQFFIHRLQFFLARFQLFRGRAQLFVDGLQLFVGRLQFFGGRLRLLDGRLQLVLRALQLGFQLRHYGRGAHGGRHAFGAHHVFHFVEQHQHVVVGRFLVAERPHHHVDVGLALADLHLHAARLDALAGMQRLEHRGAQFHAQFGVDQRRQVARGFAARVAQEPARAFGHVHDVAFRVHDDAGRRVHFQRALMDLGVRNLVMAVARHSGRGGAGAFKGMGGRQRGHIAKLGGRFLGHVDAIALVHHLEQARAGVGRFRTAQEQVAARLEGKVEHLQHVLLYVTIQVDQQVAATDQVQLRKGRVAQDVVDGEQHALAHFLLDAVFVVLPREITFQQGLRHIGFDRRGVAAGAAHGQRRFVDIRGEHLYFLVHLQRVGASAQQHGQRISLFAR
ncbi:hypothetical protein D3C71_1035900 [compost metagenome]